MEPVTFLHDSSRIKIKYFLKHRLDTIFSILLLLFLSPLFIIVSLIISLDKGPVFFIQPRVGKNGTVFPCYKFRSMCVGAEESLPVRLRDPVAKAQWDEYQKLSQDDRVTAFGKLLRASSFDELPQLFNVLRGEMSLVGPRPILPQQRWSYGKNFAYYKSVRPGITGPWQVGGRNKLSFSERIQLECDYVRNWSLFADLMILFKTIPAVLKGENGSGNEEKIRLKTKSA